jgi:thiamine monophosphate synthase
MSSYKDNFKIYYFGNKVSDFAKKKLLRFKKRNIIYINHKNILDLLELKKICKKNNIKLYVSNNIHLAKKLNINGIHISADYRKKIYINQQKFELIGTVHSQKEFYFKKQQGCTATFLSPIFNTKKYSENLVLNINKFNLLSKNWNCAVYALAGINVKNLNKLNMTKVKGFGGISFFRE